MGLFHLRRSRAISILNITHYFMAKHFLAAPLHREKSYLKFEPFFSRNPFALAPDMAVSPAQSMGPTVCPTLTRIYTYIRRVGGNI